MRLLIVLYCFLKIFYFALRFSLPVIVRGFLPVFLCEENNTTSEPRNKFKGEKMKQEKYIWIIRSSNKYFELTFNTYLQNVDLNKAKHRKQTFASLFFCLFFYICYLFCLRFCSSFIIL